MGRNPIWLQGLLTTLMRMFEWIGLYTNLGKIDSMTCTPGFIWGHLGKDAYKMWEIGNGNNFCERRGHG